MRPHKGFRELGEWGPKQPGSQEQDAKMTREQGAEESNSGSMEHRVCHKIIVFYTIEILKGIFVGNTEIHQLFTSGLILIQGSNS